MRECGERIRRERALSPRLVLRRVLVLSEGRQYREAAAVLSKLGGAGIAAVASELPLDLLVDGLPHSAQLLETLLTKLVSSGHQRTNLNAEPVIWQLVKLFACHEDPTLKTKVGRLARALVEYQPDFHALLLQRRKALEQAVQGLGCHGLTPDIGGLTHLHAALKTELQRHVEAYKGALHRLDELGFSTDSKKPVDASHQRLLSLHHSDVQQRLIDNKTLLTLLDKSVLQQLRPLIDTLATRVQNDKEALFCVSQLKKIQCASEDVPVASLLMSFSRGCGALLDLMRIPESPCHSDGYHSEPEAEPDQGIDAVGRYGGLYYQSRPRALEALDSLPDLQHATQLKAKIIFSVVVLAFRTCRNLRETKIRDTFRTLHVDGRSSGNLRSELIKCLASNAESFPLGDAEHQVVALVCDTLREYRCLEDCSPLHRYVAEVTRTAWLMVNQQPPYELETDFQIPIRMQGERHQRHHSSERGSDIVRAYLWPALLRNGICVHKAVVVTANSPF
ncbi:PREDICTED: uncharacterized protein LOC108564744 [Nicrophorus vespilloides]|uniref:Mitochondria-eating protein n=1 Tax=Nicrophorus vespilloides TaxID=110193 RepID=A0ABM1MXP5_NICVS|nr:PREDICTED: uncharacterized protein LOC108564744 [Nicrophorus vespilloides]